MTTIKTALCSGMIIVTALLLMIACSPSPQLPFVAGDGKVLAFGDSLTAGTGAADAESYPAVLSQLTGRNVINAGVPGELSAAGAARLPGLLESEHPALLILCHGGNDLLAHHDYQQISDNLRSMLRSARVRGVPVLLIAVPAPDLSLKPPRLYEELAQEFQIPIEGRALPRILARGALKSDHIHPNAAGYRQLAEALSTLLKKSGALH